MSPIVADPEAARPAEGTVGLLAELAELVAVVAVISGRPAAYLAEHLAGAGRARLHGLYGLEQVTAEGTSTAPGADRWRQAVDRAADRMDHAAGPGILVEHKGLTVTVHYRSVPDRGPGVEAAAREVASELGLVAHPGKMSIELRPPISVDKGTVVAQLADGLANVAFAGDDMGDLPAYAAMRELRSTGVRTLAVAAGGAETPQPVLDAADAVVDGPAGVLELLQELVSRLRR